MSSSKSDPFLEKIKQYAVEELTIAEQGGGIGADTSSAPGGNRKGVFGNLLLPHEWLQLDHAYAGASPSIPAEYKSLLEVTALAALLQSTYTLTDSHRTWSDCPASLSDLLYNAASKERYQGRSDFKRI